MARLWNVHYTDTFPHVYCSVERRQLARMVTFGADPNLCFMTKSHSSQRVCSNALRSKSTLKLDSRKSRRKANNMSLRQEDQAVPVAEHQAGRRRCLFVVGEISE